MFLFNAAFSLSSSVACRSSPSSSNTLPVTLYSFFSERLFGILLFLAFGFQYALQARTVPDTTLSQPLRAIRKRPLPPLERASGRAEPVRVASGTKHIRDRSWLHPESPAEPASSHPETRPGATSRPPQGRMDYRSSCYLYTCSLYVCQRCRW